MSFDSVGRISKLLDQFCDGLKSLNLLPVMRAFPAVFISLFTYTRFSSEDVKEALCFDDGFPVDSVAVSHLNDFIEDASEEGK